MSLIEEKEELDVELVEESVKKYGVFEAQAHGKPEGTIVRLTCYTAEYRGDLKASSEIEKVAYFEYSQKLPTSLVDHLLFDDLREKELIE